MRSDLQQLERTLDTVFCKLERIVKERRQDGNVKIVSRHVTEARASSRDLLARLRVIETKLTERSTMGTVAAS
jgi:hypothetical protein